MPYPTDGPCERNRGVHAERWIARHQDINCRALFSRSFLVCMYVCMYVRVYPFHNLKQSLVSVVIFYTILYYTIPCSGIVEWSNVRVMKRFTTLFTSFLTNPEFIKHPGTCACQCAALSTRLHIELAMQRAFDYMDHGELPRAFKWKTWIDTGMTSIVFSHQSYWVVFGML